MVREERSMGASNEYYREVRVRAGRNGAGDANAGMTRSGRRGGSVAEKIGRTSGVITRDHRLEAALQDGLQVF